MPQIVDARPAEAATLAWISSDTRLGTCADGRDALTGAQLQGEAGALAKRLQHYFAPGTVVGSIADNSPDWLLLDLALQAAGMIHVPLPTFFSSEQMRHAVLASSMGALVSPEADLAHRLGFDSIALRGLELHGAGLDCRIRTQQRGHEAPGAVPAGVSKMTFTSGTTGAPKAVMLSSARQLDTARSLAQATSAIGIRRHLCLLPLPVLLENVAGAYTALLTGAECVVPPLIEVGMTGATGFDPARCIAAIEREGADSLILLPQMLAALTQALESTPVPRRLHTLKFVAVGGAYTSPELIRRARVLGLPVYEGYGLSECASVTTLNLPHADRVGTVGRALPGVTVRIANDGEIQVHGRGFDGYLGAPPATPESWISTGDLGRMDDDGFVVISGRKKHVLVTSFGRNVSPEWPECRLTAQRGLLQAAVFGDARPFLCAVIVASPSVGDTDIEARVEAVNEDLPDYARIGAWIRATEPFSLESGLATANGRLRRAEIGHRYRAALAAIYEPAAGNDTPPSALASNH